MTSASHWTDETVSEVPVKCDQNVQVTFRRFLCPGTESSQVKIHYFIEVLLINIQFIFTCVFFAKMTSFSKKGGFVLGIHVVGIREEIGQLIGVAIRHEWLAYSNLIKNVIC